MFRRIKVWTKTLVKDCSCIQGAYIIVPALLVISALIIRLTTGGTHIVYSVLGERGIFPGPFVYTLFFNLRLSLSGILLAYTLTSRYAYSERLRLYLASLASSILMLFEYKLIFGGISLVLCMAFTVLSVFLCFYSLLGYRYKGKCIWIILISYAVLQFIFFIQLVSLFVCI